MVYVKQITITKHKGCDPQSKGLLYVYKLILYCDSNDFIYLFRLGLEGYLEPITRYPNGSKFERILNYLEALSSILKSCNHLQKEHTPFPYDNEAY